MQGNTLTCPRCLGCGKIANDAGGTPWCEWLKLPLESSIALLMGWVKPLSCPDCHGTGKRCKGASQGGQDD